MTKQKKWEEEEDQNGSARAPLIISSLLVCLCVCRFGGNYETIMEEKEEESQEAGKLEREEGQCDPIHLFCGHFEA